MKKLLLLLAFLSIPSFSYGAAGPAPLFSVDKNGTDQTVTASTFVKLTWPHTLFDTTGDFASDKYTPTTPGKYLFTAQANCTDATSGCSIWIYKNGTALLTGYQGNATTSAGGNINISNIVNMNGSTDYVEVYIYDSGTTIAGLTRTTFFSGALINSPWITTAGGQSIYYNNGTTGDVGIGTSNPHAPLDVNGHIRASGFAAPTAGAGVQLSYDTTAGIGAISSYDTVGTTIKELDISGSPILLAPTTGSVGIGTSTAGAGKLAVYSSSGLSVFASTNMSIGTTTPAGIFTVYANDTPLASLVRAASSAANTIDLSFKALNSVNAVKEYARITGINTAVTSGSEQGTLTFSTTNAGTGAERMRIDTSGNVGIGTALPRGGSKLDVNGTVYVGSFAAASSTAVCQNGNVLSTCSSAGRYKENIKPSELGLKEVLQMKPVTFDFKGHKENWERHDFGFVAEEMEKINPLFVTYNDKGKLEGVRYPQLTAVNSKAIQELHDIVTKQQEEIDHLQHEVDQLIGHSK